MLKEHTKENAIKHSIDAPPTIIAPSVGNIIHIDGGEFAAGGTVLRRSIRYFAGAEGNELTVVLESLNLSGQ